MITIYQFNTNGYATGATQEQDEREPIPPGWTHKSPSGEEGERFEGNVWQVVPPPAPQVPESVPALEALLALDAAGISADYEAWANDPARTFAERAFINKALTWRRDDPTLQAAAEALELSSEQVDQLFIAADQLLAAG